MWLVSSRDYGFLTSSHPNVTLNKAVEFAKSLTGEFKGDIQVIKP